MTDLWYLSNKQLVEFHVPPTLHLQNNIYNKLVFKFNSFYLDITSNQEQINTNVSHPKTKWNELHKKKCFTIIMSCHF
jgi:hypothetical protein